MKFKGTIGDQFSGSLAGITASHNRGGYYLRQRVVPTDPASPLQTAQRNRVRSLVTRWTDTLTAAQRTLWSTWAANTPFTDSLGQELVLTGQQAYVGANTLRLQAGVATISDGPTIFTRGNMGAVSFTATDTPDRVSVAFDNGVNWANQIGGYLLVYVSRPRNSTLNFFKGPFQFAGKIVGDSTTPPTSPAVITPPQTLAGGQKVFVRTVAIQADGRWSGDLIGSAIVA